MTETTVRLTTPATLPAGGYQPRKALRKPATTRKAKHRAMAPAAPRLALIITVAAGVAIPLLTLALSTVAGRMALADHGWLALAALAIGGTVLAVSLSHLAWAIQDITRSPLWASWALAIAVDLSVVLAESVSVFAPGVVDGITLAILAGVTLASMALNVWAFLRHR